MRSSEQVLRALRSEDEERVLAAVRECTEILRGGERDSLDLAVLGDRFVALAADDKGSSKVRQAIAEAAQYLPDDACERVLPPLLKDGSHYVRDEANRTLGRRSARRRTDALFEAKDEQLQRWRAEMEAAYGAGALKLADKIAARATEHFMGKLHHEAARSLTTLNHSAETLYAEVRRQPPNHERMMRYADKSHERVEVLTALLQSARTLTKSAAPRFANENVRGLVDAAVSRLKERLGLERSEEIRIAIDCERGLAIDADREPILQAIENVLQNAVEAYDGAPAEVVRRVVIRAEAARGGMEVAIRVTDDGCGMSAEALRQAYVPFGSSKQRGSGFGVPITKKMVEIVHGGRLEIESAEGRGTTVTMTLPVRQRETKSR